ncbi:hypothetical protein LCGC14_0709880 [marine sediment metagenome]|uniref:Terminase large subunit gp17-like C-terminal domain-containing protein n=1 Tax=marine sediment metagenome TaxID=412755 RepID=A0A0F9TN07_9ZZZZ
MTVSYASRRDPALEEALALAEEAQSRGVPIPDTLAHELHVRESVRRGINPWSTFRSYIEYVNPDLLRYEHIDLLVEQAERLIRREILRLMVLLPPRYFKTEVFSRLLCSYFLRKFPRKLVGVASYNASRAWEVSEQARTYFTFSGGVLRASAQAKKFWGPPEGGELWAAGVQEGTLGHGYHLGVVDDPVDPEKARSPVYQRRFQDWWPEKWISRQEPNAAIVLVMQRLGVEDPVDFLFRREMGENTALAQEEWTVLVMDELKENTPLGRWNGPQGLPPSCTLIKDKRKVGALLSPRRFNAQQVKKIRAGSGTLTTATQRQQRPSNPKGDFWAKKWFRKYDTLPADAFDGGRDWDTAYTKEEANSATAWIESYRGPSVRVGNGEGHPSVERFPIYIHDVDWDWKEFPDLVKWMAELEGLPHYVEEKASGKSAIQALKPHGIVAEGVAVKGDKFARASAVQPAVSTGRIYVRASEYDLLLSGEGQGLLRITSEALQAGIGGLDVNDAFVQALHRHMKLYGKTGKRKVMWA